MIPPNTMRTSLPHPESPTYETVLWLGRLMEYKLSIHRDRGDRPGWLSMSAEWLYARAGVEMGEVAELMT
jgi:hypothetical protein